MAGRIHSALPDELTAAIDAVLVAAGVEHRAHGPRHTMRAAEQAAGDADALALIGPFRSAAVAEAVEATAPAGLPLLAPVATWAGVTRDDEPCCGDPAQHRGTVLRMLARDTVVAQRIAALLRAEGRRAHVLAGDHEYGVQLDGQLRLVELPRVDDPADADAIVLAGLAGQPEIARAAELAPLPAIAFDGVQGAALAGDVRLALPYAPVDGLAQRELFLGVERARRAAQLVVEALPAADRGALLAALRERGPFDAHGDPVDPPVWLWRADPDWTLHPERAI